MSLHELKTEGASLPAEQRKELIAHLLAVGRAQNAAYWDKMEAKIADKNPVNWVRGEELEASLRLNEQAS